MENLTYDEFIKNILETRGRFGCGDEYHERHHIVARCMGEMDDESNLIDLFAREHFVAHKLLAKENSDNHSIVSAWWRMCNWQDHNKEFYEPTPEEYEEARIAFSKKHSEFQRERFLNPETNPMTGKHHTEATKNRIGQLNKGHIVSDDVRQKIRESKIGDKNPNYGKRGALSPLFGRERTKATKEKISRKNTGKFAGDKNPAAKKVVRLYDQKIYTTVKEAAEEAGVCLSAMVHRCKKQKNFMYYDEWLELQNNLAGDIIEQNIKSKN